MWYYTGHYLTIYQWGSELIKEFADYYWYDLEELDGEPIKGYSISGDLKKFSKKHKESVFRLVCKWEEWDQREEYFQNWESFNVEWRIVFDYLEAPKRVSNINKDFNSLTKD